MMIIHNILYNNSFPIQPWKTPYSKQNLLKKLTNGNTKKRATFTYIGKETTYITKIFKHANTEIAYRTSNTIQLPKPITTTNFQLLQYKN